MKFSKIFLIAILMMFNLVVAYSQETVTSTTDSIINPLFQVGDFGTTATTTVEPVEQENYVFIIRDYNPQNGITRTYVNTSFDVFSETASETVNFKVIPIIRNDISIVMFAFDLMGLGDCNKNNQLIMVFENGEQIVSTSWNRENCKGKSYFSLSPNDLTKMRNSPLKVIRFTNGLTKDSLRREISGRESKYFMQVTSLVYNKTFNR